jgi:serpin B
MISIHRSCRFAAVAALAFMLVLPACGGGGPGPDQPGTELRSEKQRITVPQVDPADVDSQVAGNTALALDLYHQVRVRGDGNLFFSPHSIEVALAMTWAGARTDTESAMAGAMHFELGQDRLHPVFNHLDLELVSRGEGAEGTDSEGFRLNVVNAVWGQVGYDFLDGFRDTLARHYGAGLWVLDFMADPDGAALKINGWVEEVTEERIQDLIPPGVITADTRMVLVNAIYFNAAWASPFEEENTSDGEFHTLAGGTVSVPMMQQELEYAYAEGDGYQAVEIPYDGDELSMLILVPDRGTLGEFEQRLDAAFLADLSGSMQWGLVDLTMPRWELDGETFSLKELLAELGMGVAFTPSADFSGMNGRRDLMIQDVLHQAFIKVNEAGTEAAAATAVIVGETGIPPQGPDITLDRPFIYLIKDRPTGQILFVGRLVDPS